METPPSSPSPHHSPPEILDLGSIKALKILGKGATGTVFLAHDSVSSSSPFAVKLVNKSSSSFLRRARWEIEVLRRLSLDSNQNPFLPRLLASFESPEFFAWAVPYCSGGDLNVLLRRQNDAVFSSSVIRFYVAEIVCALEHLHSMGIAYRDLKPENILIQQSGHVTLTDFDLSRSLSKPTTRPEFSKPDPGLRPDRRKSRSFSRWISPETTGLKKTRSARVNPITRRKTSFSSGERSNSFVGTDEYVSPEVIRGEGHDFSVDWWALGVLTYEMMYGETPFKGKSKKDTFRNVLVKEPEFAGKPNDLTDLIRRLLEKDPSKRLGSHRGAAEIKEHGFFAIVRWDLLTEVLRPPFIPLRDDGELTVGGFDIREHFESLRMVTPSSSAPPSPLQSTPHVCHNNDPFVDF